MVCLLVQQCKWIKCNELAGRESETKKNVRLNLAGIRKAYCTRRSDFKMLVYDDDDDVYTLGKAHTTNGAFATSCIFITMFTTTHQVHRLLVYLLHPKLMKKLSLQAGQFYNLRSLSLEIYAFHLTNALHFYFARMFSLIHIIYFLSLYFSLSF